MKVAIALGLAFALLVQPAFAADSTKRQFDVAQKLFDDHAYDKALPLFEKLASETGSPNAELYVARCLRELGRLPEAYERMRGALRGATAKAANDPRYAPTRDAMASELALLDPKVAKIVLAVADPPPGMEITLNGAAFPSDRLGVPLAAVPGDAAVHASAPGKKDVTRTVSLRVGQTTPLTLAFQAAAPPEVVAPPVADSRASTPVGRSGGGVRVAGFVVVGVGVGGMVTFAVAGLMANHRYDSLRATCGGHCGEPPFASALAGGKELDAIADVGLAAGIASLTAGTFMIGLGGSKQQTSKVAISAGPGSFGVGIRGGF